MLREDMPSGGWLVALFLVWAALGLAPVSRALAQERDLDIERWAPAPDGDGFLSIPGTRTPGPWRWNVGLALSYAREPLVVNVSPHHVVSDRLDANLWLQLGVLGRLALVVNLPVVPWQSGAAERIDGGPPLMVAAIRDPRIAARIRVLGEDATEERERHEGEGLALQAAVTLPLGHQGTFAGEGAAQVEGALLGDFHLMDIGVGAILGFRHRLAEPVLFPGPSQSSFRNQLFAAFGLQVPLFFVEHVVGLLEVDLTTDAERPFGEAGSTASEWRLGARVRAIRDVELTAAVGSGLVGGVGAPAVRGILAISWAPRVHDRDRDGIVDDRDACRTLPEDFDAHDDEDGCPEPDNDRDLVPDLDDRCPNEAAEEGRDLDDDGCTDPVLDADADGLEDRDDRCPTEPEDRDEHQDDDGCPDPDDDNDGVPDAQDQCPREPEDRDEHQDDDGCPDPDDDNDGVLDAHDRCPEADETINGRQDDDGCPDRGRPAWTPVRPRRSRSDAPASLTWGFETSLRVERDGRLGPAARATLAQLARIVIADRGYNHRLLVGGPERATVLEALDRELHAALEAAGMPALRVEAGAAPALAVGRVRVVRTTSLARTALEALGETAEIRAVLRSTLAGSAARPSSVESASPQGAEPSP